jgi:hypothetical protein
MAMARTPRGRLSIPLVFATVVMMSLALSGGTAFAKATAQRSTHHHHHHRKDSDHDGMPNKWEKMHHLNAHKRDAKADPDKDHLNNLSEFSHHTLPHAADTDKDGLYDGAEVHQFHSDPKSDDSDGDGVSDGDDDGDGDGVADGSEDGSHDGFVGTIISYDADTGRLLFESSLGWPITALVTDHTKVLVDEACNGGKSRPKCTGSELLQEGRDILALHFAGESFHGVPVIQWLVLACPDSGGGD